MDVANVAELLAAIGNAKAGDEIVLVDGTYRLTQNVACSANGTAQAPIRVRAKNHLAAKIEIASVEGFVVSGAGWQFEGLDVTGVCASDASCEHAFHVVGGGSSFVLRRNRIRDFNAQLKVNASQSGATWITPNDGLVEYNEVGDTRARNVTSPVTKLNIDTGDRWIVRGNYIHDFHRQDGAPSYGAFMKSGGKQGLFERNLVLCTKDDATTGTHIGLSFGGGGTGAQFCAPAFDAGVPCDVEHDGGTMRNNIIANCSDVGVYLNRAKDSRILHNTLIGTTGIDFRFATSSGTARGNVLAGPIRNRDGATGTFEGNLVNVTAQDFDGYYMAPLVGDLRKKGDLGALLGKGTALPDVTDDYCARTRTAPPDLGALQHSLGDCETTTPIIPGAPPGGDGGVPGGGDGSGDGSSGGPGASSSSSGSSGASGASPNGDSASDDGCGCRAAGRSPTRAFAFFLAFAVFGAAGLRRRRRS